MMPSLTTPRAVKLAAILVLALSGAACSSKPDGADAFAAGGAGGAATPGSARDFAMNVGDRVFFESDQTDLTSGSITTLDKQAQWLSRYPRYTFLIEGHADERGTREYNFSLGSRRAHAHRLLRQGAAGGRLQRHLLLVAEPACRDGPRRRRGHVISPATLPLPQPSPAGGRGSQRHHFAIGRLMIGVPAPIIDRGSCSAVPPPLPPLSFLACASPPPRRTRPISSCA